MNAEFHKIARKNKKFFLNEQYKDIEENNRMGDQSPLQENWRYQ